MIGPESVVNAIDWAERVGPQGLAVRAIVALSTAVAATVASAVGQVNWVFTLPLALFAIMATARPDSLSPLLLIGWLTLTWMVEVRPLSIGWSAVLGLAVLVIHSAAARAAALGDGASLDGRVALEWAAKTGAVAVATLAVWGVELLLDGAAAQGAVAVSAAAIVAVLGAGWALVRSEVAP